ncbi:MAG TPA: MFS transporter [Acetobacteraceae bacterium]|nr:MFS transporter [Acetobacteraceae bacterium]
MGESEARTGLPAALATSLIALAALNFLIAAIQTGFGPFLGLVLTDQGWSQEKIGIALSAGTIAGLVFQLPAGALVDAVHRKRGVLSGALALTALSALGTAFTGAFVPVVAAQVLHVAAAAVMNPAIAAVTLSCTGHGAFSERLGSNTRWSSLGSAAAAVLLGLLAARASNESVFVMTALLCAPAILAAWLIRPAVPDSPDHADHLALVHPKHRRRRGHHFWTIYLHLNLHRFAFCVLLFQAANAAMMPVAVNALAARTGSAGYVVSIAILVSQCVGAALSPSFGRYAERFGRRPILLLGFGAMPLKGLIMTLFPGAVPLVLAQVLDGVSGAVLGIMLPLVAADLTRHTGFMNLAIGSLNLATGIGATISTAAAGWLATAAGPQPALGALAATGLAATVLLWAILPETKPQVRGPAEARAAPSPA